MTSISTIKLPNGKRSRQFEQSHRVQTFRRLLPAGGDRADTLVQFYAAKGGMRTLAVKDIVDIS